MLPTYSLTIDDIDLWRQAKAKAALEGMPLKAVIDQLLREWLNPKRHDTKG